MINGDIYEKVLVSNRPGLSFRVIELKIVEKIEILPENMQFEKPWFHNDVIDDVIKELWSQNWAQTCKTKFY